MFIIPEIMLCALYGESILNGVMSYYNVLPVILKEPNLICATLQSGIVIKSQRGLMAMAKDILECVTTCALHNPSSNSFFAPTHTHHCLLVKRF